MDELYENELEESHEESLSNLYNKNYKIVLKNESYISMCYSLVNEML